MQTVILAKNLGVGVHVVNKGYVKDIGYCRSYESWCAGWIRSERGILVTFNDGSKTTWAESALVRVHEPEGSRCTCGGNTFGTNVCGNCGGYV